MGPHRFLYCVAAHEAHSECQVLLDLSLLQSLQLELALLPATDVSCSTAWKSAHGGAALGGSADLGETHAGASLQLAWYVKNICSLSVLAAAHMGNGTSELRSAYAFHIPADSLTFTF